jgi:hypothetical protein
LLEKRSVWSGAAILALPDRDAVCPNCWRKRNRHEPFGGSAESCRWSEATADALFRGDAPGWCSFLPGARTVGGSAVGQYILDDGAALDSSSQAPVQLPFFPCGRLVGVARGIRSV